MKIVNRILLLLGCIFIYACSENDKTSSFIDFEEPSISTDSLAFKGRGGFRYIDVQGGGWFVNNIVTEDSLFLFTQEEQDSQKRGDEFVKTCGWLTVKSWTGRIVVYTDANQNREQRSFKIELCNNSDVVELKGTQDVMLDGSGLTDKISPSSRAVKFDSKGGEFTITTENNYVKIIGVEIEGKYNPVNYNNWKDDTLDKQFNWLAMRHDSCVIELRTEENLTTEPREFKIDLMDGNFFTTISGIQQAAVDIPPTDTIGFTPSKVHFPLEGGTVEVMARTDGWEIDEKSNGLDWLTIEQEGTRLRLTATPNFDYDIRHFTLRCKKGDYYEYLEGEQETR